ncbi:MAG: ATP-binding protein [Thermoleophilia bacterium]
MHAAGIGEPRGSRLVGRARELAQLEASLERVLSGRGDLILLTGEPGIGKTALAREFVNHAAACGATWAWGSCWDGGGAPAYWPWVQIGRALGRHADEAALRAALGEGAPWIAGLLPDLAGALGPAAEPAQLDCDQARFQLFDALATALATIAQQRPLVLVLDDLQWADASSLRALEFVARVLPDTPLLAIAAYRRIEAHARADLTAPLGGLARAATRLPLEGLTRDDVGRLAQARARGLAAAGSRPIAAGLVTSIHRATAGNPFLVDELVELLAARGRLHDDAAGERPLPLPDGVRDAIRRRLDPLGRSVQRALAAAAVIGADFELQPLATVLDQPPAAVLEWLEAPLRDGIVRLRRGADRFAFAHGLVRDTLLDSLDATSRAQLHRVTAEALEHVHRDDLDQHLAAIARHYLQAATEGGAERGVDYAVRAAQRAVGQFAYEEAARLYEGAIDVAASLPADERRAWQLAQGLGEARGRAGDVDGARSALRAAAEHARRLDDHERLAQTALARTLGAFSPGLVEPEIVRALEEALGRLEAGATAGEPLGRANIDALRCRLRVQLALSLYWSPDLARRERLVDEALGLARALYTAPAARTSRAERMLAERTLAFALAQGFVATWGPDTVARGLPISAEALELCERTNDAELGIELRLWRISLLLELDDRVRAEEEIEAFAATARRLGQRGMLVYVPLQRAMAAHMRGDLAQAERFNAEAAARSCDLPGSIAPLIADAQTYVVRRTQGRHLELEPLVRRNADRLPAMRRWRCELALALAELGRDDEARRELEQLAAADFEDIPRDALWLVAMSLLAELVALLGDRRRARRLYELLVPYEGRSVVSMGAAYLGPVARYLGLLAMTIGEHERALGHLETARSAAERIGARPAAVLTALDTAEVLVRRGAPQDVRRGRDLVEQVAPQAAEIGMAGAAARADALLARLREAAGATVAGEPRSLAQGRPERAVLRREQDVWLLEYGGREITLHDVKGLHHLATLLQHPGTPIAAVELAAATPGVTGATGTGSSDYRARVAELREELGEAQAFNDPERIARARERLELLAAEMAGAGVETSGAGERARINVTRAIKAAVLRIAKHDPELGRLLRRTVRTGAACAYRPDPGALLEWEVDR